MYPSPKTAERKTRRSGGAPYFAIFAAFFFLELFAFCFLSLRPQAFSLKQLWPLAFGAVWAGMLTALLYVLPNLLSRILFPILYFLGLVYAAVQTGYYHLFSQMMWLSDFRYASEGMDYADVLLSYPIPWWASLAILAALGIVLAWKYPRREKPRLRRVTALIGAAALALAAWLMPNLVFLSDSGIRYAGSDYGRMQSTEAAYDNMFNAHRLYQVCGLYQTALKDLGTNILYPLTPGYAQAQEAAQGEIDAYFAQRPEKQSNDMTGLFAGKNVVLVLMESMDDWMIGEHTPTISRLMAEGIQFTNFYTPVYGGIRTFNTEFAINTGSFLSSAGGYAFDYVTNAYPQSLASLLTQEGYSAKTFHYNDPNFYSRGVFSQAMGYEDYVCYADFVPEGKEKKNLLYDDKLLFDNDGLNQEFFRSGSPTLNFIITRSAHLSYQYNEVLSHWGLKQYPEYRGLTGSQEQDCALLKARLVDDMFTRLLEELEEKGELDNTVIIAVTDHYTYGYKNEKELMALSGVGEKLLLEKTPAFIWSSDLQPQKVEKLLNTTDLLPTVLNLLGVDSPYPYIGQDAFDARYEGFVPFSNGSWMAGEAAWDASAGKLLSLDGGPAPAAEKEFQKAMGEKTQTFIHINNLILETDYYRTQEMEEQP